MILLHNDIHGLSHKNTRQSIIGLISFGNRYSEIGKTTYLHMWEQILAYSFLEPSVVLISCCFIFVHIGYTIKTGFLEEYGLKLRFHVSVIRHPSSVIRRRTHGNAALFFFFELPVLRRQYLYGRVPFFQAV